MFENQFFRGKILAFYTECLQGKPCLGLGRVSFLLIFFIVVRNHQINLCIKICPPLVGMYCSDWLQQKQANQNLLFGHISRESQGTHSSLPVWRQIIIWFIHLTLNKFYPPPEGIYCSDCLEQKQPNQNLLLARISRGMGPTYLYLCDVKASHHFEKLFLFNGGHMYEFKTLICFFQRENKPFLSGESK